MSRRRLSDDERALWRGVARGVTPLRRDAEPGTPPDQPVRQAPPQSVRKQPQTAKQPPALVQFDRRLRQRVARGHAAIDVRLDLHGLTQQQAHAALFAFPGSGAGAGRQTGAGGHRQRHRRRSGRDIRTRRVAAASAIMAVAAGVPPLYRQFRTSARRPRRRRRALPALAAPPAIAAVNADYTHR
jgi:hypothetical protein